MRSHSSPSLALVGSFVSLSVALVALVALSGCAAEATEDTGETSDALTLQSYVKADGDQTRYPEPASAANPSIGSVAIRTNKPLYVYCKVESGGRTWLASNLDTRWARSYVEYYTERDGTKNVEQCFSATASGNAYQSVTCGTFVSGLRACDGVVHSAGWTGAGTGTGTGTGTNTGTGNTGASGLVARHVPAGARTVVSLDEPVTVFSPFPGFSARRAALRNGNTSGDFTVAAVWNAYDGTGRLAGTGACPPATFRAASTGIYSCFGNVAGAVRFAVDYYATGPAASAVVLR